MIFTKHIDKKSEQEFASYVEYHPYVIDYGRVIAPWQLELDLEAKNTKHYYEIIDEILDKFPNMIKRVESVYVLKEHKFRYAPV